MQRIAQKASSLNLPGTQSVPTKLTPEQQKQITDAVKKFSIEVYTGKEDRILRKLVVNADVQDTASKQTSHLAFELTLDGVGSDQDFSAPKNAKPFSELLKAAKGLSPFGAGTGGGAAPGASADTIDKYSKCVEQAKGDIAKMQKCADLISG